MLCCAVAVGNIEMTEREILSTRDVRQPLVSLLKKNWQNVKSLYIKSTGRAVPSQSDRRMPSETVSEAPLSILGLRITRPAFTRASPH